MDQSRVLILWHSFIRRLFDFIVKNNPDYHLSLNLTDSVTVEWHGVGGRTIAKVRQFAIGKVQSNLHYLDLDYPDILCGPDLVMNIY